MERHLPYTRPWSAQHVRDYIRGQRLLAFAFLMAAAAACFVTAFVLFGLCLMLGMVFAALGIPPPHPVVIAPAATLAQFMVYWFVRDAEQPGLSLVRADDTGEWLLVKPDRSARRLGWYDQAEGYSVWRSVASVALATPVAAAQAWRHWRRAGFMARADREDVAQLAAYLLSRMEKASLAEIQRDLPELDLAALLPRIEKLRGFNVMAGAAQGIALTETGQDLLLAAIP